MNDVLARLREDFGRISISPGASFCWAPGTKEVIYNAANTEAQAAWSLLHEFGHALLNHTHYHSDFELVRLEVAAWQQARQLAARYGISIDEDHIQDCLDTYRDWLHRRSVCPTCGCQSLQRDGQAEYECFNCHTSWRVSSNRFGRSYRRTQSATLPAHFS